MKTTITTIIALFCFVAVSPAVSPSHPSLDKRKLGQQMGGWNDKNGEAAKFRSAGSKYRLYKPDATRGADRGLFVSTKLDHVRGMGGDDHAQLQLWFDSTGVLKKSRAKISMGDHSFDTGIITQAANASVVAGGDPRVAAIANLSASVLNKLNRQVSRWNEHGGRANFPSVIEHSMNRIANNVR